MLEIKNIRKNYKTGTFVQKALDDVSIKFRSNEFVAILGPSGSGKTTCLNILGGLDHYDSGDLVINGKSTTKFKDKDWDAYRNNSVGFIFQSYNLIGHISVLSNVEMSLTLSNVSSKERKQRSIDALKKVGLSDHIHKKPNQLSGGQMQRVAIARSLVNDPDVILADEPTGALDSKTSTQIMELIKNIADDKLVIMVTHNRELAEKYASRIIEFRDGKVISDSNPIDEKIKDDREFRLKKTKMSFFEALHLSFNNILTKKGRTILTAFASSIGIIGIALILALSNGFNIQVGKFEKGILSAMPIMITEQAINMSEETMLSLAGEDTSKYPEYDYIIPQKDETEMISIPNTITEDYVSYIEAMDPSYSYGVSYEGLASLTFIQKYEDKTSRFESYEFSASSAPISFSDNKNDALIAYYDLLEGSWPKEKEEMILLVDSNNRVNSSILTALNLDTSSNIDFDKIIGTTIRVATNDDIFISNGKFFDINTNSDEIYEKSIEVKITGIIRMKEEFPSIVQSSALIYTNDLLEYVMEKNNNSKIVEMQRTSNFNVLTGIPFTNETERDTYLAYLGSERLPYMIYLFPKDFDAKENMLEYLDKYNENKKDEDKIIYTDQAEMITAMSGSIMDAITIVLIAFSSISLVVSSIMIGIITYISVLERTKEIGILRALGARKKDISRVFNAETFIIGITSGVIGILIALVLTIPANQIIYNLTELENVAILNPIHALVLIIISMTLTVIGGIIPAKIASKKDPVEALRTE